MSKLDWMYKSSSTLDPEEYLLGRSIDKNYENQSSSHNEVDKDILPTSIFAGAHSSVQVDVFRKKKEDPLEQIKQKEIEMRKQLLKNPVKLKKLQSLLKAKEEKKSQKDKKKKQKRSKDKDIDELLAEKYMTLISKYGAKNLVELTKSDEDSDEGDQLVTKHQQKKRVSSNSSSSLSSDEERSSRRRKNRSQEKESLRPNSKSRRRSDEGDSRKRSRSRGRRGSRRKSRSRSGSRGGFRSVGRSRSRGNDRSGEENLRSRKKHKSRPPHQEREDSKRRHAQQGKEEEKNQLGPQPKLSKLSSSEESTSDENEAAELLEQRAAGMKHYDYSSDEGKSKFKKAFGLVLPKGVVAKPLQGLSDSGGDVKASAAKPNKYVRPKPASLTEEEKQAKLKEMMEDAQKWEQTRKAKVHKYREEQKKEDAKEKKFDGEFMRKELAKATSKSVAERIKSNINNLQRSKFSMDQHFAKRT